MGADFISQTLNRKLFKLILDKKTTPKLNSLTNKTKKQLFDSGRINESTFKKWQKEVNERIKQNFKFKILR